MASALSSRIFSRYPSGRAIGVPKAPDTIGAIGTAGTSNKGIYFRFAWIFDF